jgi:methyl-accepting chemotaxis protein
MFLVALGASMLLGTLLVRPIRDLTRIAANIVAAGDLTQEIRIDSADEVGALAESFRQMVQKLRVIPASLSGLVNSVVVVVDQVSGTTHVVASGAKVVDARSRESTELMEAMLVGLEGISKNVDILHGGAQASTASNREVVALNDEVAAQVKGMAKAVDDTSASITDMSSWIRQVSDNIDGLNSSIEETSLTMNEMDTSIRQVEANAKQAVSLSTVAAETAATGVASVQQTLDGIEKIRASSAMVSATIRRLGDRISNIGKILGVIDDVAEQTNLLALNAAIIAAQAGEKGRAFAVVADEIKELASRVGVSTAEIVKLIRSIQSESEQAIVAVDRGMGSVTEGVTLAHATAESLNRISQSVQEAMSMIRAIAQATIEQARSSSQVTTALHRIADSSQQVHTVSQSQAKSSEQITQSAKEMQRVTQHVRSSTGELRKRSQEIADSMASVSEMVRNLRTVLRDQSEGAKRVLRASRSVQEVVSEQTSAVLQLEQALPALRTNADGLQSAVQQFRV